MEISYNPNETDFDKLKNRDLFEKKTKIRLGHRMPMPSFWVIYSNK